MADQPSSELPQLLSAKQLAPRLNVTVETLANWRNAGIGPAYVKLKPGQHGHVRYKLADVETWVNELQRF